MSDHLARIMQINLYLSKNNKYLSTIIIIIIIITVINQFCAEALGNM